MSARSTAARLNVAEAKKRLSDLLGRVAYGKETIVITRRGRPMAKLVPATAEADHGLADVKGWLDDDDPFFKVVDEIVASRKRHRSRALRGRRGRAARRP